ncbi:VCBS repeat-containing protein [Streptomyces sp. M10(2022)]
MPLSSATPQTTPYEAGRRGLRIGRGITPSTRTVYGRQDLGLPEPAQDPPAGDSVTAGSLTTADLDSDGFPDFVTSVGSGPYASEGHISAVPTVPYVTWGGPEGPDAGAGARPVRLPQSTAKLGVDSVVRGDFDGDGHHDLAALAQNQSSLVLLYGPFTRAGAPARSDTALPWSSGSLVADDIDPSGKPRATSCCCMPSTTATSPATPSTRPAAAPDPQRAAGSCGTETATRSATSTATGSVMWP